jgi:aerobic-type carbon monoxide dehydrogenase small subunit (CoxS/CutS family)
MCHAPTPNSADANAGVSRRAFLQTAGLAAAGTAISSAAAAAAPGAGAPGAAGEGPVIIGPDPVEVTLNVNGKPLKAKIDPATTLLEALRIDLDLTGAKEVCERAACGACSVIVDGRLVTACMVLALDAVGRDITTVEGLPRPGPGGVGEELDPVQREFVRHDALQCGFCTPGLVMACRALLNENPKPTLGEIKAGLAGNICRCGTYTNVFNACLEASGQPPISDSSKV